MTCDPSGANEVCVKPVELHRAALRAATSFHLMKIKLSQQWLSMRRTRGSCTAAHAERPLLVSNLQRLNRFPVQQLDSRIFQDLVLVFFVSIQRSTTLSCFCLFWLVETADYRNDQSPDPESSFPKILKIWLITSLDELQLVGTFNAEACEKIKVHRFVTNSCYFFCRRWRRNCELKQEMKPAGDEPAEPSAN